jgi:hypothetical protein
MLRPHQVQVFAQDFEQSFVRRKRDLRLFTVQAKFDMSFLFHSLRHGFLKQMIDDEANARLRLGIRTYSPRETKKFSNMLSISRELCKTRRISTPSSNG